MRAQTIRFFILLAALACFGLAGCDRPASSDDAAAVATQPESDAAESWDDFVSRYLEEFFVAHPAFAVVLGRHEFDGQLPDWSEAGINREIARLHSMRKEALAFSDAAITSQQRYERDYLVAVTDRHLFWLEKAEAPFKNPAFYLTWLLDSLDPAPYLTLDYAPIEQRMAAYIRYASNIPKAALQIRENLRMPMARSLLEYGIASFGGFAAYFANDVPGVWAGVDNDALQDEFEKANSAAAAAMGELTDWLKANRPSATEDFALGKALFQQMIYDTERVDISLEELEAIGRADMARNQKALAEACQAFAPGAGIRDCFAKMANRKPEGGPVRTARRQLEETKAFVVAEDLVTIPGAEEALVRESPPYARSNSAYINIPGPYEKGMPSIYYISPPDPNWAPEVQAAFIPGESDLLFTSVHEVWPGHFLNFLHANRAEWVFGRAFVTYAFGEGWAHYTEEMMLEAGLRGASPETRIGQIANALLRNARFLSAIGLHTQGMTLEQSRQLFIEEAYQDEGTAMQQAARGTYDPEYLNYTMGKLMIRRLRDDWVAGRGGRAAWREFHDKFLSYGGPPIPMVRGKMMGGAPEALFLVPGER